MPRRMDGQGSARVGPTRRPLWAVDARVGSRLEAPEVACDVIEFIA